MTLFYFVISNLAEKIPDSIKALMVLNSFYTFLDYIIRNFINAYRIFSFNFILKPQPSLDDSARFDHSWESDNLVFTSSDFTTKCFLYKAWS
jgi:hypothetical protein